MNPLNEGIGFEKFQDSLCHRTTDHSAVVADTQAEADRILKPYKKG